MEDSWDDLEVDQQQHFGTDEYQSNNKYTYQQTNQNTGLSPRDFSYRAYTSNRNEGGNDQIRYSFIGRNHGNTSQQTYRDVNENKINKNNRNVIANEANRNNRTNHANEKKINGERSNSGYHYCQYPNSECKLCSHHDKVDDPKRNSQKYSLEMDKMDFIGTTYGSEERPRRIFGENFKYMKHYVRQRSNSLTNQHPPRDSKTQRNRSVSPVVRMRTSSYNPDDHKVTDAEITNKRDTGDNNLRRQNSCVFLSEKQPKHQILRRQNSLDNKTDMHFHQREQVTNGTDNENNENKDNLTFDIDINENNVRRNSVSSNNEETNIQSNCHYNKEEHLNETQKESNRRSSFTDNNNNNVSNSVPSNNIHDQNNNFFYCYGYRDTEQIKTQPDQEETNFKGKYVKLSNHKLLKLKETNNLALKRKDDLQRELLNALKKISELEVSHGNLCGEKRELIIELRMTKQRVGDAEREAASTLGRVAKLEQDIIESNNVCQRYLGELSSMQKKVNSLEDQLCDTKANYLFECSKKEKDENKMEILESELKILSQENLKSNQLTAMKTREIENLEHKLAELESEKKNCLKEIEENSISKIKLEDLYTKLQKKKIYSDNTNEQLKTNLREQKIKFDIIIKSRINLENELNKIHDDLAKERLEKEQLSIDHKKLQEESSALKSILYESKERFNHIHYENQMLRDRFNQLGLQKQVSEHKNQIQNHQDQHLQRNGHQNRQQQKQDKSHEQRKQTGNKTSRYEKETTTSEEYDDVNEKHHVDFKSISPRSATNPLYSNTSVKSSSYGKNSLPKREFSRENSSSQMPDNHEKIWDRSAYNMNHVRNNLLFEDSNVEENEMNSLDESITDENTDNSFTKPTGVTFAPEVETFDDSENNFSDMLHKENHDLANAFMG